MRNNYELVLNSKRYHLSESAKHRLKWIWQLEQEHGGNISRAAKQLNVSRQWLSILHGKWLSGGKDPRKLEPMSRSPHDRSRRVRISQDKVSKIIALRRAYPAWGKEKIARLMLTRYGIRVGHTTVNRYLGAAKLLNVRLSQKNTLAYRTHMQKLGMKHRPPAALKDYKPGALIEKDMKFIVKQGVFVNRDKFKANENFFFQHTMIDDFTRIRVIETTATASSASAKEAFERSVSRFPFPVVCINSDWGGENGKEFTDFLAAQKILHFFSRIGTPTDNPRVERSHLTDESEFFGQGNRQHQTLQSLQSAQAAWEQTYNWVRPHQALGYLSPMEFYKLWKDQPAAAYAIAGKWRRYLKRQSQRLTTARRMKKKEQIEALMQHIDAVLTAPSYH